MAFLNSQGIKEKFIFILLGPSGSGKTSFATWQSEKAKTVLSLSTGQELRKQSVVNVWQEPDMCAIKDTCQKLIRETFKKFTSSKKHEILILDCVKDLEDAEFVAAEANRYNIEITRALLFDIGPEDLHENWISRGEDRDIFRGSARAYLTNWKRRSNNLLNYYKKSKLLSVNMRRHSSNISVFSRYNSKLQRISVNYISEVYPLLHSTNNLSLLVIDSVKIKHIFAMLHSILEVNQLQFTLPSSFVHCRRDVTWVTSQARYHVTAKTDGVRCLLIKIQDGTYLITRSNDIYPCCIADDQLPFNTILDGELLPSSSISEIHPKITTGLKTNVFLIFDVLAVSGEVLWKWPFSVRYETLRQLPISKDVPTVMKKAQTHLEDKANELEVNCVIKEHMPSGSNGVLKLLETLSQLPYPCDGLVFTPNTSYVFGPDPLLFKWQSEDSIHCDILLRDLKSGKRECAVDLNLDLCSKWKSHKTISGDFSRLRNEGEVLECQWNRSENAWDPLFVRQDKSVPNSEQTIDHVEKMCQQSYTVKHFVEDLTEIERFDEFQVTRNTCKSSNTNHPSLSYSYDELYAKVTELVKLGYIEKTVDFATKLEIVNYCTSVSDPIVSLCRGMVLHPDSKTIVTKPFIRFFEDVEERDPTEMVEATIKYDGSLGMAFLWNDKVMVTTRRRMDSEQAIWAKRWIDDNCNLAMFQTGYTYLFEIISQNNTVIVNYPFQGLVLLAISNASGQELPYEELLRCARNLGFFMVTPRITGTYSEIQWYCGGIETTSNLQFVSGALPMSKRQEGWVVKFQDGKRQKVIYTWWKDVSKLSNLVHPQIIWLLVKHDKFREILANMPNHFRVEIHRMIRALGRKFDETVREIEQHLTVSSVALQYSDESSEEMNGHWISEDPISLSDGSDDSENGLSEELSLSEQTELIELGENVMANNGNKENSKDGEGLMKNFIKFANKFKQYWIVNQYSRSYSKNKNISPIYKRMHRHYNGSYLRLPVLDYICPKSPVLDGYEPSANFKQTWCKGWKVLPLHEIQFVQEVLQKNHSNPLLLQLPIEVIVLLLMFLDGKSLAITSQVCMQLHHIIQSSTLFEKKMAIAKQEHDSCMAMKRMSLRSYNYYSYSPDYSWSSGSY